ncbi:hypothetical protein BDW69DRAFT_157976 [Aspergillus filifer]
MVPHGCSMSITRGSLGHPRTCLVLSPPESGDGLQWRWLTSALLIFASQLIFNISMPTGYFALTTTLFCILSTPMAATAIASTGSRQHSTDSR